MIPFRFYSFFQEWRPFAVFLKLSARLTPLVIDTCLQVNAYLVKGATSYFFLKSTNLPNHFLFQTLEHQYSTETWRDFCIFLYTYKFNQERRAARGNFINIW